MADKHYTVLTIGQLATELRTTRDVLRAALSRAGVHPAAGTTSRPLYRLKDVLEVVYVPTYHRTIPGGDA